MAEEYYQEVFEYPIKEFKTHLENPLNERILFSGKYGIGKTSFLDAFFKNENQTKIFGEDGYEVYKLCPINYSIATNEDILKYIKYDLIIELLNKKKENDEIELSFLNTLPDFFKRNLHKVAAAIVHMIPGIGKSVVDSWERIDKLKEEFLKYHDAKSKPASDKMIDYLEDYESREGSIFENDVITKIISGTIRKEKKLKTVLIVDDVDRLDPEHVFRILNVFASHFDNRTTDGKNKFGFEKVIVVCDFHNIQNLFHHRYGSEVDFMGYIDKFYSSDIYHFDNRKAIKEVIEKVIQSLEFNETRSDHKQYISGLYFKDIFVHNFLALILDRSYINLRSILKMRRRLINYHSEQIAYREFNREVQAYAVPVVIQIKLLKDFVGGYQNFIKIIQALKSRNEDIHDHQRQCSRLLFVLSMDTEAYSRNNSFLFNYEGNVLYMEATFNFHNDVLEYVNVYRTKINNHGGKVEQDSIYKPTISDFWKSLIQVVEKFNKMGYLN